MPVTGNAKRSGRRRGEGDGAGELGAACARATAGTAATRAALTTIVNAFISRPFTHAPNTARSFATGGRNTGIRREASAMLLSHVDLRVRNRAAAEAFYDALLSPLGAVMDRGATFTIWQIGTEANADWFGITEDANMTPNAVRVAFAAPSRGTIDAIATILPAIGARNIELPDEAYGTQYYACFFEDLDGNRLELVHLD